MGSETEVSDWVTEGWMCAVVCGLVVCTGSFVALVPRLTTLDGISQLVLHRLILVLYVLALSLRALTLALNIPQDCVISFDISFKISLRHILCLRNWGLISRSLIDLGSMKMALVESRLVEIAPSVLSKIVPSVEIVLIILNRRESGRSDLDSFGTNEYHRSNALTMSLSSATSDEMAGVEEFEFTLQSSMNLDRLRSRHCRMYRVGVTQKIHGVDIPEVDH
nr:hypothetical protein [Tanacetum cinerariifolium]